MMPRAAIGRALRGALVFVRGPCPSTAAAAAAQPAAEEMAKLTPSGNLVSDKVLRFSTHPAAASASRPAEEVDLSMKNTVGRRSSRYFKRPKKTNEGSKGVPWLVVAFVALAFLEGLEGEDDLQRRRRNQ